MSPADPWPTVIAIVVWVLVVFMAGPPFYRFGYAHCRNVMQKLGSGGRHG